MRIFVTGGTGLVGRTIVSALRDRGDAALVLTRSAARGRAVLGDACELVEGDPQYPGPWQDRVGECDAVVHLAGEPVGGKRWDARFKQILHDSRVDSTMRVVEAIDRASRRPSVLVSASGIDFYPWAEEIDHHTAAFEDDPVDESAPPGSSFLARVCSHWEEEARRAEALGTRVVYMRTGMVLGHGGALDRLRTPFALFAGGRLGSGRQWTSWIHIEDVCRAYLFALDTPSLRGPVNLVAPANARNAELARALGRAMGRPAWIPAPKLAIHAVVGEFADYALHGRRAVPAALEAAGFHFQWPELDGALANLCHARE